MTKKAKNKISTKAKSKLLLEKNCHKPKVSAHKNALSKLNKITKVDVF